MEKDLESKLYMEYFEGKEEVFELLYNKYKSKIQYFIFIFSYSFFYINT